MLFVITILLNMAASFVLFRVPLVTVRGRSNPVYLCIRFLNISDLIQAFLLLLMPIFATPDCGWKGGMLFCNVLGFLALYLLLVSPLITILMAFDRVIALYQPFKYRSHLGLTMLKVLLPCACCFVAFITILPIFGVGEYHVVRGRRMCLLDTITDDPVDQIYVLVVHYITLCALLFMAACTVTFQLKLCRMNFDKKHQTNSLRKRRTGRRTRNATITTMAVC
uniref:G-protein coupled receptors family 1 profile domain-containing protein n=1 Tax=Ciona savignyi TaxID=51511 RepID=H2YHF9_CIOSA